MTKSTIIRTICLGLALVNQVLACMGKSPIPIDDEQVTLVISTVATIVTALISWWKNNSFTSAAIEGDKVMRKLKSGEDEENA